MQHDVTIQNIWVTIRYALAVGLHLLWIVKMSQHIPIDVTHRLLYAQQNVVDVLHGALQRLLSAL